MRMISATVLVTACATAKVPASVSATATTAALPTSAAYANLFDKGASWRFHSEDKEGGHADTYDTTCVVADVRLYAGGIASHVTCGRPVIVPSEAGESVAGMWVSDARGLSHAADWEPSGTPTAEYLQLVLPIVLVANAEVVVTRGSAPDAWCATWDEGEGPSIHRETCFEDGAISGGDALVDNHGTTFSRAK